MGQMINGGQCYGLTAYYVQKLGGPQLMGSGFMYAESIGSDYDWKAYGWEVIFNPKYSELKAGDVINWYAGQALSPGTYGIPVLLQVLKVMENLQRTNKMPDKGKFVRDIRDNGAESLLVYQVLSEKIKEELHVFANRLESKTNETNSREIWL